MAVQVTNIAKFAGLTAIVALSLVSGRLYSQQAGAPPGAPGGRAGRGGRGRGASDPNVNQFRTIDGVKYVDGEFQVPNSQPNPYHEAANWPELPAGRKLAATSAIAVGPNGHIWVADRCSSGMAACTDSDLNPVFEFDASGKMLHNFGAGIFVYPHGLWVDKDGFVWVTDARDSKGKGQQVIKFSPDGKIVMRLGKAGVAGLNHDTFNGPCAVVTTPSGDIFVADGHENAVSRIVKFNKDGKYLMEFGKKGTGPGEFDTPHAIAIDSQGRLFVGDRANSRVQVFTQDGKLLEIWRQFGRPSGLFIDGNDVLYSADSESNPPRNPGFKRGIRIGSVKDGKVRSFIPYTDMAHIDENGTHGVEGVSADGAGNVYGSEVSEADLKKYEK
ncbi:MAG: peptidyl-alpha-hydroxyglycine alpha-amidating lyase family protein [Terriglobia bacterium]